MMGLLVRAFVLLLLFLLPANLFANAMNSEDDDYEVDYALSGYISFYGLYPKVQEYDLTGSKDTKLMDAITMGRDNGYAIGSAIGLWSSPEMAIEIDFQYLNRVDKISFVTQKNAMRGDDRQYAGHLSKLETQAWKIALLGRHYLSSMLGMSIGEQENPWISDEENMDSVVFAPYVEVGVNLSYDTKKIQKIVDAAKNADSDKKGAALGIEDEDEVALLKFNKSHFLSAWQVGCGLDFVIGESIVSLGYRLDWDFRNAQFKQKINSMTYSLSYDMLKTHNALLAIKFEF